MKLRPMFKNKVVLWLCFVLFAQLASAQTNEKYNEIAGAYLGHALSNASREITKPVGEHSRKLWRSCISRYRKEKCSTNTMNDMIRSSLAANENFRPEYSQLHADLQIIFADEYVVKFKKSELDKTYLEAFRDSADPDCAVYYRVKQSVVSDRIILISVDAPANKQRMCLAIQFFQGLGLTFERNNSSFANLWSEGANPLSKQPENQFNQLVEGLSIFTLIHMCPDIHAGMKRDQVTDVLRSPNCWQGLYLK
jgi:hypothetical protein